MKNNRSLFYFFSLILVAIFLFNGCAKKVVKKEEEVTETKTAEEVVPEGENSTNESGVKEEQITEASPEEGVPGEGMVEETPLDEELSGSISEEQNVSEVNAVAQEEGKLLPVYFDFDKYSIREDAAEALKKDAQWLKNNPDTRIQIEGHADERGSNEYNLALGDRRAKSIRNYLEDLGVTNPMSTISYGEEKPVCTESNESCWSKNRRAEFMLP